MTDRRMVYTLALGSLVVLALLAGESAAQSVEPQGALGSPEAAPASVLPFSEEVGDVFPSDVTPVPPDVYRDSLYSTGGTSLRNMSQGGIQLSGNGTPPPPATAAFAYWAVITAGPHTPNMHDVLFLRKLDPRKSPKVRLKGAVVGVGPDPCWPGDTITVFKAPIPLGVVNAGGGHAGVFDARLNCTAASSCLGEDPWGSALPPPLWEGASIVAIWPHAGTTTTIYDVGLSGMTFFGTPGLSYTLVLPLPMVPGQTVLFDNIGADGQHGFSRGAVLGLSDEVTRIAAATPPLIAGPGSAYTDSDWNGNDSNPLPSLWDTTGHSFEFSPDAVANPFLLPVSIASASGGQGGFDCLTPVANVVAQ